MTWARDPPIRMVNASLNKLFRYHGGVKYKYMLNYHIKDMEWEKKKGLCNLFNSFWWWSHYIQCTSSNSSCLRLLYLPVQVLQLPPLVGLSTSSSSPGLVKLIVCLRVLGDLWVIVVYCFCSVDWLFYWVVAFLSCQGGNLIVIIIKLLQDQIPCISLYCSYAKRKWRLETFCFSKESFWAFWWSSEQIKALCIITAQVT